MRYWYLLYSAAFVVCVVMFLLVYLYRSLFVNDVHFMTLLFVYGVSSVLLLISAVARDESLGYAAAYGAVCTSATPVVGYVAVNRGVDVVSVVVLLPAVLAAAGVYMRYGEFKFLDYMWVFFAGYAGFWIIIIRFSWMGTMALFFATVTLLTVVVLSYALLLEDGHG